MDRNGPERRSGAFRKRVSLLACLLLCPLILYTGWSRNHRSTVGPTDKHIVVDTSSLGTAGPSKHIVVDTSSLGTAGPSKHIVVDTSSLGTAGPSKHIVVQTSSLGTAGPSKHIVVYTSSLGTPGAGKQMVVDSLGMAGADEGSRAGKPQFRFINRVVTAFDTEAYAAMQQLVTRKAQSRDPQLVNVVRHLIDPPPTERSIALSKAHVDTPQFMEVDALLNRKTNGFFVECGGYDGETASNSLPLENKRNWTGVLIEANPFYYSQLLGKSRNVWSLNACLSPYEYATQLQLESGGQIGQMKMKEDKHSLADGESDRLMLNDAKESQNKKVVPCFPLETILLALNRTHIDYFSLDVEGLELDVLKTIPFDRINIRLLTVEYAHGRSEKQAYKRFMEGKGFKTHKELVYADWKTAVFVEDYVFVKQ